MAQLSPDPITFTAFTAFPPRRAPIMTPTVPSDAPSSIPVLLIMHTAVDFLPQHGVGIAVAQQACDPDTPGDTLSHDILEPRENKFSIYREKFAKKHVQTQEDAEMRAIVYALFLARHTIRQTSRLGSSCFVKRLVISGASPNTVVFVNQHIALGFRGMPPSDCSLLESIIAGVEALSRPGLSVSIDVAAMVGTTVAAKRAEVLSRQRGRVSCMARLRHKRNMNKARSSARNGDGKTKAAGKARNAAEAVDHETRKDRIFNAENLSFVCPSRRDVIIPDTFNNAQTRDA